MIKVIGIDPGLAATGIGIIRGSGQCVSGYAFGSIRTSKDASLAYRLDHIYSKLLHVIQDEAPDLMVVEDVFSLNKYPKSGIILGKVSGVILLAGSQLGLPVIEIPVREVKKVLTGNGNANKCQLEKAVRHKINHKTVIHPNHASDAIALALIGLYRYDTVTASVCLKGA